MKKTKTLWFAVGLGSVLALAACKDGSPVLPDVNVAAQDRALTIPVGESEDVVFYLESRFTEIDDVTVLAAPVHDTGATVAVSPSTTAVESIPGSVVITITCKTAGDQQVIVSAEEAEEDGRFLGSETIDITCVPATGSGGSGGGGGGAGGEGGMGGEGGSTGITDPLNDCPNGTCSPEMDMASIHLECVAGEVSAVVAFAEPMPAESPGESSRVVRFFTANEEHQLQASAFNSPYSCGYRVNFAPTPLPAGAQCEVDAGRMMFSLPAGVSSEDFVSVELSSGYYDGMTFVMDEAGPFPICD